MKVTKAATKQAAKTWTAKPLLEAAGGLLGNHVTESSSSTVINCINWVIFLGTLVLLLVYIAKGNVVAMFQVPGDLSPLPVSVDIPRGKSGRLHSSEEPADST